MTEEHDADDQDTFDLEEFLPVFFQDHLIVDADGRGRKRLTSYQSRYHGPEINFDTGELLRRITLDHNLVNAEQKSVEYHEAHVHEQDR